MQKRGLNSLCIQSGESTMSSASSGVCSEELKGGCCKGGVPHAKTCLCMRVKFREAPDTFKCLRHVMRLILSVLPKCSHRCVFLKETPLKLVQILTHATRISNGQTSLRTKNGLNISWFKLFRSISYKRNALLGARGRGLNTKRGQLTSLDTYQRLFNGVPALSLEANPSTTPPSVLTDSSKCGECPNNLSPNIIWGQIFPLKGSCAPHPSEGVCCVSPQTDNIPLSKVCCPFPRDGLFSNEMQGLRESCLIFSGVPANRARDTSAEIQKTHLRRTAYLSRLCVSMLGTLRDICLHH